MKGRLPGRPCSSLSTAHMPAAGRSCLSGPVDLAVFPQLHSPAGYQLEGGRKDLMFCQFDSFRQRCNSVTPLHRDSLLQDDLSGIYILLEKELNVSNLAF